MLEQSDKSVTVFKEVEDARSPIKRIPYGYYLEGVAKKRGLLLKGNHFVNEETGEIEYGQICEDRLFGRCKINNRNKKIPVPSSLTNSRIREKAKKELFSFARKRQPKRDELMSEVKSKIEESVKEKLRADKVIFYSAIGTSLDYNYGIDGWIEITKNGETTTITIDLKNGQYDEIDVAANVVLVTKLKTHKQQDISEIMPDFPEFVENIAKEYEEINSYKKYL
ncbi:MAG TPA: hypothetical protein ENJ49_01425 [Candidatus Moranbacteria bacterium]|nr:hypothetical protein [Candidatus Moranbacteria bacterium]